MNPWTPPASPASDPAAGGARGRDAELESAVTLGDFLRAWARYKWWYLAGLVLDAGGTIAWAKLAMTVYYRAEAAFSVTRRFTPESRPGLAEAEIFRGTLNEQFQALHMANAAEQYLHGDEFLLEVADALAKPEDGAGRINLMELLEIDEPDARRARLILADRLKRDLIETRHVETSGIILLAVELPDAEVAARFVNVAIDLLQGRFTEGEFRYFESILELYDDQIKAEEAERLARSEELARTQFDRFPGVDQRRTALAEWLTQQAEKLAEMRQRTEMLRMAVSPEAKAAAEPITVIDPAVPPLKKNRPKVGLLTVMTSALYTFVFMTGLAIAALAAPLPAGPGELQPRSRRYGRRRAF